MKTVLFSMAIVDGETIESTMNIKIDGEEQSIPVGLLPYEDFHSVLGHLVDIFVSVLDEHENIVIEADVAKEKEKEKENE